ncbi:MAG: hypothetical protein JSR45_16025 [Proteobacteria bacterium]|nr:hypothetical protein [Pseudomonadota bacterium]
MRTLIAFSAMIASTLTLAGAASAQPQSRLNDLEFVKAARCAGLADGTENGKTLRTYVDTQSRGRGELAQDRADQARREAALQMRAAKGERLQRLSAERDACAASLTS